MASDEFTLELVPVTVEVGRAGRSAFSAAEEDTGYTVAAAEPRRQPAEALLAAALAIVAGIGAVVATVDGGPGSKQRQAEAQVRTPPRRAATAPQAATAPKPTAESARPSGNTVTVRAVAPPATGTRPRLAPPLAHPAPTQRSATERRPQALLPNSGFASGGSHLLVDRTGRRITTLVINARCAPGDSLPPIPIGRDRTFRFVGTVRGTPATRVTLTGRFTSRGAVTVRAQFVAPGCDSGRITRTLRLS